MRCTRCIIQTVAFGLLIASAGVFAAQSESVTPQRIATPASVVIPCDQSPFGKSTPMVRDLEPLYFIGGSSGQMFEEYRPSLGDETPPMQRVYRSDMIQPPLVSKPFQKSINVDLNGDGRDEVVVVFSDNADVRLAVYSRSEGFSQSPVLIDTWSFTEGGGNTLVADSIDMVAGDLDGSGGRQKELALSWWIGNGDIRVVVLKGDSAGHIVQADGATAGTWLAGYTNGVMPHLAIGDFLLDGRDQLALVNVAPTGGPSQASLLNIELIEFNDGSNATPPNTALPNVGSNVRSQHFQNTLQGSGSPFGNTRYFAADDGNGVYINSTASVAFEALDADGGDVVDTAAAELVVHLLFQDEGYISTIAVHQRVLGQRLLHFDTARDTNNVITAITLGNPGINYDSSRVVEKYGYSAGFPPYPYVAPAFAATVADVDGIAGKEIVTVRAGHEPSGNFDDNQGHLTWWAHKVHVRVTPSFQYKNQGTDTSTNQSIVAFTNNTRGDVNTYDWNFGDGTPHSAELNPVHRYTTTGSKTVTLTVTPPAYLGGAAGYSHTVNVTGGFDATPQGDAPPPWTYKIDPNPTYSASEPNGLYSNSALVKIAAGDFNRDGLPEVFTVGRDINNAIHRNVFRRQADGSFGFSQTADVVGGVSDLDLLLSDFDGDSLDAVLSNTSGDCRTVSDKQMRSLTWMPPYFSALQADAYRAARYGKSSENSSSTEERSGSYTSHDVTGYLGVGYELSAPILAIKLAEWEVKASFGHSWQSEQGSLHGSESDYSVDQGFEVGTDGQSANQEGVLTTEQNTSNCYSYNVVTASGIVPGSALRACEVKPGQKVVGGPGASDWNRLATEPTPIQAPIHWVPVQRDWASLALFHVPTAGSPIGGIGFSAGHSKDQATDGLFTTSAESDQAYSKPYLEVDLGEVRDISAIRVFPTADPLVATPSLLLPISFKKSAKDLWGFRVYASATPFSGSNPPTGASVTTFVPGGTSTFVQDTGTESVYSSWNIWTGDPNGGATLHARYLRLQKPTTGKIRVAEIQVFGDTHADPPAFPDAVCDARVGDGLFQALVYDNVDHVNKTIEVRGDMLWTGAVDYDSSSGWGPTGVPGCSNDTTAGIADLGSPETVRQEPIWQGVGVGHNSIADWSLSQSHSQSQGSYGSIDSATHLGVEFEAKLGAGVQAIVGASYEFTFGATQEHQTSLAWGSGFAVSGQVGGFSDQSLTDTCLYFPRPYAYQLTDYSNTGFRHDLYVTDYVVRQQTGWQRGSVPPQCYGATDAIFANGFE